MTFPCSLRQAGRTSAGSSGWFPYPRVQLERLMKRNSLSEKLARDRINSQMALAEKIRRADTVIDNSGTMEETRNLVLKAWERLNAAQCV